MADKTGKTAGKPDTIAQALNAGRDVIEKARQLLPSIPSGPQRPAPATLGDAQALVQERQQQALQHKEPKPKQKGQAAPTPEQAFPGSRVGAANDNSAYWTLVEEYFRDVTRQDFVNLLLFCVDPDDDDALLVPQLGAPHENAAEPQPQLHLPASAPSMKAFGGYSRAAGVAPATGVLDEGDDAQERKRSSRLAGKAMRRDYTDRYDDSLHDGSSAQVHLASPLCLLEQIPAADLLTMTHVNMQLQQLSTADVAAAVGIEEHSLDGLLQRALQPASQTATGDNSGLGGYGGQCNPGGSSSKHQKQRDAAAAAAASSWAAVSAGIGGPQLTAKQRQALAGWLQRQCAAPEVGQNMRGPVAAAWTPPTQQAAQAGACQPANSAAAEPAVTAAAAVGEELAGQPEQRQSHEQPNSQQKQQKQTGTAAEQTAAGAAQPAEEGADASIVSSATGQPAAEAGLAPMEVDAAAVPQATATAAAAAAGFDAAAQAPVSTELVATASPAGFPEAQLDLPPQEIAAVAAAVVAAAAAPPPAAVDAPDENELRLAADTAKREEMRVAERVRRRAEARLELHPYIRTLLARPLPPHIADPGWDVQELGEDEPDENIPAATAAADTAAAAGDAAAGASVASASKSVKGGKAAAAAAKCAGSVSTAAADSAVGAADEEVSAADGSPAVGGSSGLPPNSSGAAAGRGGKAGAGRGKGRGRGKWGGRKSAAGRGSKSGAAGKAGAGKAAGGCGAAAAGGASVGGSGVDGGEAKDKQPPCAAAQAVQAIIAAAPPEGSLEQQWQVLDESADVISLAPDDEVLAELLALQGELLQQAAINRARLGAVLQAALDDLPRQAQAAAEREQWEADITNYAIAVREARKEAKRLRREAERRAAAEQLAAAEPLSPRVTAARAAARIREGRGSLRGGEWVLGSETDDERAEGRAGSPAMPKASHASQAAGEAAEVLADTLASRDTDDALCAVCGEGHSEAPNQIIFCERCDLPVHQLCYCVDVIPEGEWLCWPCAAYEEQQRRAGIPQAELRPPRWQLGAGGPGEQLPGGSRGVQCALCPVNCGAFKLTKDGSGRWVHMVCALWHQEPRVDQVNAAEAVSGLDKLEGRLATPNTHVCQVCRRASGVTVRCAYGHCSGHFHPLCGRARGHYLAIRPGVKTGLTCRAYCAAHSDAQRQKDREAAERALAAAVAGPPPVKQGRRGRPPAGALAEDYYTDTFLAEHEAAAAAANVPPPLPEVDAAVLQAIAGKEQHYWTLQGVRLELERARLLADQVRRREKLKLALAKTSIEVHEARLEEPLEGLADLLADVASHAPIAAAAVAAAAAECLQFSTQYDAEEAAVAAALPPAHATGVVPGEQQQQQCASLQDSWGAVQQVPAAAAAAWASTPAETAPQQTAAADFQEAAAAAAVDGGGLPELPVTGDAAVSEATAVPAVQLLNAVVIAAPAAVASPGDVTMAEQQAAAAAAADDFAVTGSTHQSISSVRPTKQAVTGSKRKQPSAAEADAPPGQTQQGGSAVPPLAAAAARVVGSPSTVDQQQQQVGNPLPVAEVPIVLSATAKRRRTAGPGGPGRRGGTGVRSPTAAAAAAAAATISTELAVAGTVAGLGGSPGGESAAADKGSSWDPSVEVLMQQGVDAAAADVSEAAAAAQQQSARNSRAGGSRKRARLEPEQTAAVAENSVAVAAAAVQAKNCEMQADPLAVAAAAVPAANGLGSEAQSTAEHCAVKAASAATKAATEEKDQSRSVAAAVEHDTSKQQQQESTADLTDEQQQSQDKQHDQIGKPPRKREQHRRSTATELRLLQADLAHSSFQPLQGRSRRGSRDGGASGGGLLRQQRRWKQQLRQQQQQGVRSSSSGTHLHCPMNDKQLPLKSCKRHFRQWLKPQPLPLAVGMSSDRLILASLLQIKQQRRQHIN